MLDFSVASQLWLIQTLELAQITRPCKGCCSNRCVSCINVSSQTFLVRGLILAKATINLCFEINQRAKKLS